MDKSRSSNEYLYHRLYWVHALIRYYLITGRKYVLIKKYVLNKHVRLLTRLYGTVEWEISRVPTFTALASTIIEKP